MPGCDPRRTCCKAPSGSPLPEDNFASGHDGSGNQVVPNNSSYLSSYSYSSCRRPPQLTTFSNGHTNYGSQSINGSGSQTTDSSGSDATVINVVGGVCDGASGSGGASFDRCGAVGSGYERVTPASASSLPALLAAESAERLPFASPLHTGGGGGGGGGGYRGNQNSYPTPATADYRYGNRHMQHGGSQNGFYGGRMAASPPCSGRRYNSLNNRKHSCGGEYYAGDYYDQHQQQRQGNNNTGRLLMCNDSIAESGYSVGGVGDYSCTDVSALLHGDSSSLRTPLCRSEARTTNYDDDDVATTTSGSYVVDANDLCNEIDDLFFKDPRLPN